MNLKKLTLSVLSLCLLYSGFVFSMKKRIIKKKKVIKKKKKPEIIRKRKPFEKKRKFKRPKKKKIVIKEESKLKKKLTNKKEKLKKEITRISKLYKYELEEAKTKNIEVRENKVERLVSLKIETIERIIELEKLQTGEDLDYPDIEELKSQIQNKLKLKPKFEPKAKDDWPFKKERIQKKYQVKEKIVSSKQKIENNISEIVKAIKEFDDEAEEARKKQYKYRVQIVNLFAQTPYDADMEDYTKKGNEAVLELKKLLEQYENTYGKVEENKTIMQALEKIHLVRHISTEPINESIYKKMEDY